MSTIHLGNLFDTSDPKIKHIIDVYEHIMRVYHVIEPQETDFSKHVVSSGTDGISMPIGISNSSMNYRIN
jgi:hypothetical protein